MKEEILEVLDKYLKQVDYETIHNDKIGELENMGFEGFGEIFNVGYGVGYDEAILQVADKIKQIINK